MTLPALKSIPRAAGTALLLSAGLVLAGCGGLPTNRSLDSVNQPVVERTNYTLDVSTGAGGLSLPEQRRLAGWFEAMNLKYGDRIAIDDPLGSHATKAAVEALASRYGLLLSDRAPVTPGYLDAGTARIVITRSTAHVPGCPDWRGGSDFNPQNATSPNYGCATDSTPAAASSTRTGNLAALVADPEDLIRGKDHTGETVVMSSTKAISTYRQAPPSGAGGQLKEVGSKEN